MGHYRQYAFAWSLPAGSRAHGSAAEQQILRVKLEHYLGFFEHSKTDDELHARLSSALTDVRAEMAGGPLIARFQLAGSETFVFSEIAFTTADETPFDDLYEKIREVFKTGALEA